VHILIIVQSSCSSTAGHQLTSFEFCERELGIGSPETVVDWNNSLREVCATKILNNPVEVGGPGTHVEIDESMFVRRKGNVGRLVREQWVFGGICRETRQCFLVAVPDRKKETLFGEICRFIKPQTVIISDCWPGYVGIHEIPGKFYKHLTVNHSQNFVDPDTGADTNLVENMWGRAKVGNR